MATYKVRMKEGAKSELSIECDDLSIMDDGTFNFWKADKSMEDGTVTVAAIPATSVIFAERVSG